MTKERKEFRTERFVTKASDISDIYHPDPEIEKKIRENIEKAKKKEQENNRN